MDLRTLIVPSFTSLCESTYPFSLEDDLGRPDLVGAVLRKLSGSPSSGLSSLRRSGLSHLFQLRHSSDFLGLGEVDLPSALLPWPALVYCRTRHRKIPWGWDTSSGS
jgi:hypothetical protein